MRELCYSGWMIAPCRPWSSVSSSRWSCTLSVSPIRSAVRFSSFPAPFPPSFARTAAVFIGSHTSCCTIPLILSFGSSAWRPGLGNSSDWRNWFQQFSYACFLPAVSSVSGSLFGCHLRPSSSQTTAVIYPSCISIIWRPHKLQGFDGNFLSFAGISDDRLTFCLISTFLKGWISHPQASIGFYDSAHCPAECRRHSPTIFSLPPGASPEISSPPQSPSMPACTETQSTSSLLRARFPFFCACEPSIAGCLWRFSPLSHAVSAPSPAISSASSN